MVTLVTPDPLKALPAIAVTPSGITALPAQLLLPVTTLLSTVKDPLGAPLPSKQSTVVTAALAMAGIKVAKSAPTIKDLKSLFIKVAPERHVRY